MARALTESFPYVRAFGSVEGWGLHFLASGSPIKNGSAKALTEKLPPAALTDILEWGPYSDATLQFQAILDNEVPVEEIVRQSPQAHALHDDRPINEYFLLRRLHERDYLHRVWNRLFNIRSE